MALSGKLETIRTQQCMAALSNLVKINAGVEDLHLVYLKGGGELVKLILIINTEVKLHFAYISKNMTDNATGKN